MVAGPIPCSPRISRSGFGTEDKLEKNRRLNRQYDSFFHEQWLDRSQDDYAVNKYLFADNIKVDYDQKHVYDPYTIIEFK